MQFAHIVPVRNMEAIRGQKYNMFLTHLVEKYSGYKLFAREQQGFKILDNSLIELGSAVDINRVVLAAYQIDANEIILPDAYLNKDDTLRAVKNALDQLANMRVKDFRYMAVVQGKNSKEWYSCFEELNKIKEIHTLGIPKVTTTLTSNEAGRAAFVNCMPETYKDVHLLGCWNNLFELLSIKKDVLQHVRGIDTSLPALYACKNLPLDHVRTTDDVIDLENDHADYKLLEQYIQEVNKYVAGLSRV